MIDLSKTKGLNYLAMDFEKVLLGRTFPLVPFYDKQVGWKIPTVIPDDKDEYGLLLVTGVPAKSIYISESIIDPEIDISISFLNLIYKHLSFEDILSSASYYEDELSNIFIIIAKLDLYQSLNSRDSWNSDYVRTEVEYLFITCRSLFDSLQKILVIIWNKHLIQYSTGLPMSKLPEAFSWMVFDKKGRRRSIQQIVELYKVPEILAEFYFNSGFLFQKIKSIRDDIVHKGKSLDYFICLPEGFAISEKTLLYKSFDLFWSLDRKGHNLCSIRPFINLIVSEMLSLSDQLTEVLYKVIKLPESIVPVHSIFYRCPQIRSYRNMQRDLESSSWWINNDR